MYDNNIPKPIIKGTRPASGNPAGKLKNIDWLRQHHQEYQRPMDSVVEWPVTWGEPKCTGII